MSQPESSPEGTGKPTPSNIPKPLRSVEYDLTEPRPNPAALYHCGLNSIGKSCAVGPTPSGRCCQEQWIVQCGDQSCAKTCDGAGKCEVGQLKHTGCEEDRQDYLPCIPIKNSWHSRNILSVNLAILAGGILLVCMAVPNNESIFVPGELSTSHAQILGSLNGEGRCSTCHPNSHSSPTAATQEQLCMNCHQSHMKDAVHGFPHDLSAEQFTQWNSLRTGIQSDIRDSSDYRSLLASGTSDQHWQGIHTQCSDCHQEHHGDSRSLKSITDARCQSCHQQQFASFSQGHPEFRQLPSIRPRRIAFDHVAHLEKHFPQNNSVFECSACHQTSGSPKSEVIRTVSFQLACASCHDKPLRAASTDGWALLQLPSLNARDIPIGGPNLVDWPVAAQYGYDGPITLPMRLLLSGEPTVAEAMAAFPKGDLSQVRPEDTAQQAAARTIAVALRQLLSETAEHGQLAWQRRLTELATRALRRELDGAERELIQSMVTGLPPDLFRHAESLWFDGRAEVASNPAWMLPASLISLQDNGLSDDGLLVGSDDSTDDLLGSSSDLLDSPPGDLLSGEDVDDLLRGSSTEGLSPTPIEDTAAQALPLPPESPHSSLDTQPNPSQGVHSKRAEKRLVAVQQLSQGGWFLDDQLLAIRYMPRGHADPVVSAWIQFAMLVVPSRNQGVAHNALIDPYEQVSGGQHSIWSGDQAAMGQCTECHLLPNPGVHSVSPDDWKSLKPEQGRRFTRFDHRPHLTVAGSIQCQTCHRMNTAREQRYAKVKQLMEFKSPGERGECRAQAEAFFLEEFHSIEKAQCSSCHRPGGAPEGCTQCHNYHLDTIPTE